MSLLWLVPAGSFVALLFSAGLIVYIFRQDAGNEKMREIAGFVSEGARSYLRQQYKVVGIFFAVVFLILLFMVYKKFLVIFVPFAFLTGGFWSALCGWIGMWIATNSSSRTAQAASHSLNSGLRVAFSSGSVMGLMVVGLGLLDLAVWFYILNWYYSTHPLPLGFDKMNAITSTMLCFGMGASSYALFARVGGGIFTKAADVGADLVGKIEAGIPEDDPRNPAVIADNVGDNVGDVAGMGADLYESYVDSIVATMALAAAAGLGIKGVIVPMLIAVAGLLASVMGFFGVRTKKESDKDLIFALRRGVYLTAVLIVILSYFVIVKVLGRGFLGIWLSVIAGLLAGILLGMSTEYFTSNSFSPTRRLSHTALTGPATVIIGGISLGMFSTLLPVVFVGLAILSSFYFSGGAHSFSLGLYGVGIAAVGMLSTLGITLASDAYGPVADNAGGNAEMAGLDEKVRERTDKLDALGNTTAATGKGFAIGSAALTALALVVAYRERVDLLGKPLGVYLDLSLLNPRLIIGLFLGGMMPFLFSSFSLKAVGETASFIIDEVRRQFREIPGLMEGKAKADYSSCVRITTKAAQVKMILPALSAIIVPVLVGILLGIEGVAGLLVGSLTSGFVLAIMMANSGGSWDNAKKYIEQGNLGGKGSDAHKAAIVGDTVGDPFKDTSGPSLNILIKLMSMVSIVFSSFIVAYSFFK